MDVAQLPLVHTIIRYRFLPRHWIRGAAHRWTGTSQQLDGWMAVLSIHGLVVGTPAQGLVVAHA